MFKKLVSNLPFQPSLITQVTFYAKRLRAESSVRRIGLVFTALSIIVQTIVIIAPPEPTLAKDINNDVLPGGFASQSDAVNRCQKNEANYKTILEYLRMTCDSLAAGQVQIGRAHV